MAGFEDLDNIIFSEKSARPANFKSAAYENVVQYISLHVILHLHFCYIAIRLVVQVMCIQYVAVCRYLCFSMFWKYI